ncbi:hypothetical protein E2C01_071639 [Portunus trituberculatus]|uniref:Uncharacterized protein n=1 Tax=Portunus trituberculatus TaxID=210409 RepID=A0A5B7HVV1_PORTR|nr:hypothetical protein [Portunus trituberculatus]
MISASSLMVIVVPLKLTLTLRLKTKHVNCNRHTSIFLPTLSLCDLRDRCFRPTADTPSLK